MGQSDEFFFEKLNKSLKPFSHFLIFQKIFSEIIVGRHKLFYKGHKNRQLLAGNLLQAILYADSIIIKGDMFNFKTCDSLKKIADLYILSPDGRLTFFSKKIPRTLCLQSSIK